jgi:hypothetical protein
MRTTLTLDDDVAAKLKQRARRSGRPFRVVVNEALRHGLAASTPSDAGAPFRAEVHDLGPTRPGMRLDDIAGLLEQVEGPLHR